MTKQIEKKLYVAPKAAKHKAVAAISGSGSSACGLYTAGTLGGQYYH